jgi:hypothetical protein
MEAKAAGAKQEAVQPAKQAAKEEVKAQSIIKSEALKAASEQAKATGAVQEAKVLAKEAAKQEIKAVALAKAETHKAVAQEAKAVGAKEEAKTHAKEATKQEAKALAIVKAEVHKAAAQEAQAKGAVQEAKAHAKEAAKQEARAETKATQAAVVQEKKAVAETKAEAHEKAAVRAEAKAQPVKAQRHRARAMLYRRKVSGYDSMLRYADYSSANVLSDTDSESSLIGDNIVRYHKGVSHNMIARSGPSYGQPRTLSPQRPRSPPRRVRLQHNGPSQSPRSMMQNDVVGNLQNVPSGAGGDSGYASF